MEESESEDLDAELQDVNHVKTVEVIVQVEMNLQMNSTDLSPAETLRPTGVVVTGIHLVEILEDTTKLGNDLTIWTSAKKA